MPKDAPIPPDEPQYVEATELKTEPQTEELFEVDEVGLDKVDVDRLTELVTDAWHMRQEPRS